ncbi:MAG: hypothetical protein AAF633_13195 [Chloroflexota bacterium]
MTHFGKGAYLCVGVLVTCWLTLFASPAVASTVPGPGELVQIEWKYPSTNSWGVWAAEVDFYGNQPNGRMLIELGHYDVNGDPIIDYSEWYRLDCIEVGRVTYHTQNVATFDGNGSYVHCELFDFIDTVAAITSGGLQLNPHASQTQILAKATANPKYNGKSTNPILYTDAGYALSIPSAGQENTVYLQADLPLIGKSIQSDMFIKTHKMDNHRVEINDQVYSSGLTYFENSEITDVAPSPKNLVISGHTTTLEVGANTTVGDYFKGDIEAVFFDPFVIGRCC